MCTSPRLKRMQKVRMQQLICGTRTVGEKKLSSWGFGRLRYCAERARALTIHACRLKGVAGLVWLLSPRRSAWATPVRNVAADSETRAQKGILRRHRLQEPAGGRQLAGDAHQNDARVRAETCSRRHLCRAGVRRLLRFTRRKAANDTRVCSEKP